MFFTGRRYHPFLLVGITSWVWQLELLVKVKAASSPPNNVEYGFDRMNKIIQRLDTIESAAPDTLMGFFDASLESTFSAKPGAQTKQKI
jgi:hypothetical protein